MIRLAPSGSSATGLPRAVPSVSAVVGASARQHAQDNELARGRVATEAHPPPTNPKAVLVVAAGELAYVGARVVVCGALDGPDHLRADRRIETAKVALGGGA